MTRLVTRLDDLHGLGRCVLLASGGLDSAYCMHWAAAHGLDLVCLHIDVGGGGREQVEHLACSFGHEVRSVDAREQFARDFVGPAIQAGVLYQGVYPLSASLSRPLMAQIAVEQARALDAKAILHTSEPHQNSFNRFNISLATCGPEMIIGSPFLESRIDRSVKTITLERDGVLPAESGHSVDTNLWCRVVENGVLDDSTARVPESIFVWTRRTRLNRRRVLELEFESGIPVAVDDRRASLADVVTELNPLAGSFGIGRYNGFEQTPWGSKNHEVREAPAASLLLNAVRHLRQVSLSDDALGFLDDCAHRWQHAIVRGRWFASEASALRQAICALNMGVSGKVELELGPAEPFVVALQAQRSLAIDRHPSDLRQPLNYLRLLVGELDAAFAPSLSNPDKEIHRWLSWTAS